jgi:hypothetical protein
MIVYDEQEILNRLPSVISNRYVSIMLKSVALEIDLLGIYASYIPSIAMDTARDYNSRRISIEELAKDMKADAGSGMTCTLLLYSILKVIMPEKKWGVYVTDVVDMPFVLATYRSEDHVVMPDMSDYHISNIKRGRYTKICSANDAMKISLSEYRRHAGIHARSSVRDAVIERYGNVDYLDDIIEIEKEASVPNSNAHRIVMSSLIGLRHTYRRIDPEVLMDISGMIFFVVTRRRVLRAYRMLFKNINPCSTSPGIAVPTHPMFSGF